MTLKQQKLVHNIIENNGNVSKSMLQAGYSKTSAHNPHLFTKSKKIQTELQKMLQKQGITLKKALKPIADGLEAEKQIVHGKDEDSFVDIVPDHPTRLKASSMALDLLGVKHKDMSVQPTFKSPELDKAITQGDEIELQRIVFNKKDDSN